MLTQFPQVIGIGSHQGDDQAGWLVLDRLKRLGYQESDLYRALHPADIFDVARNDRPLIICDASHGAQQPGAIHRIIWPTNRLLDHHTRGTHDLSLIQVLNMGEQLQCFPETVTLWTIDGCSWISGAPATAMIEAAAGEVAERIWESTRHA